MSITASKAITSATTKLYASAALPTTYDKAGYEILTWTAISDVNNIGSIGGTVSMQKHMPIDSGTVVKIPGSRDEGSAEITMAKHQSSDTQLLQTAFDSRSPVALKIVYPTALGVTAYTTGYVSTAVTTIGTSDTILEYKTTVDLATPVIEVANS
jgi:hypothetical protein